MPSRLICSVLDEMRTCHKTRNYSYLLSLIEEAQVLANRMEAGLEDVHRIKRYSKKASELKAKVKKLKEEVGEDPLEVY